MQPERFVQHRTSLGLGIRGRQWQYTKLQFKLTFTSDLAMLVLWEQMYRAQNIIAGTGYHHE